MEYYYKTEVLAQPWLFATLPLSDSVDCKRFVFNERKGTFDNSTEQKMRILKGRAKEL